MVRDFCISNIYLRTSLLKFCVIWHLNYLPNLCEREVLERCWHMRCRKTLGSALVRKLFPSLQRKVRRNLLEKELMSWSWLSRRWSFTDYQYLLTHSRKPYPLGCEWLLSTDSLDSKHFYKVNSYLWVRGGKEGGQELLCTSETVSILRFKTDCQAPLILQAHFPFWM